MKMKVFLGLFFAFVLSKFSDIRADEIEQIAPTRLRKYHGRILTNISETNLKRTRRQAPGWEGRYCSSCGLVNRKAEIRTSILKGNTVSPPYKYPWMVAIYAQGWKTCTGAIISEYHILTAAHCLVKDSYKHSVFEPPKAKLEFFNPEEMGVAFVTSTYMVAAGPHVQEVIPHKLFTMSEFNHDIGLLKLKEKIICHTFNLPICLPPYGFSPPEDAVQTISGWGSTTGKSEDYNYILQQAKVKPVRFEDCRGPNYMKEFYYCMKGLTNQAACYGDSGGPAFYEIENKAYLIGVASYGHCRSTHPFFYTSVPAHINWIYENMELSYERNVHEMVLNDGYAGIKVSKATTINYVLLGVRSSE